MNVTTAYISASANRHPGAADVSPDSLVLFGSSNLIAIWDIGDTDGSISETLPGHEGMVTCIRVKTNRSFFSADDKGVVRYWGKTGSQWKSTKFQAHAKAISSLCVLDDCLVTGSSEAVVKIWKLPPDLEKGEVEEVQAISLSGRYPLALGLARLPGSNSLVLAIGGTDKNVQLWTRSESTFVRSAVLMGHEDWVRGLAFNSPDAESPLVLASASQDATIRLWNIETFKKEPVAPQNDTFSDDFLDAFEESLGDFAENEEGVRQISLKRHILSVKSDQGSTLFSVTFDALLVGHEAGVTSVSWRPTTASDPTPTLLSTSTDSSLILWSPASVITDSKNGSTTIWINRQRFGDIGGQRLGGFVGGVWNPDGRDAIAWGWSGGWRRWHCQLAQNNEVEETWAEVAAISGHSGSVKSISWSPSGTFLISAGLDQTTRLHGSVLSNDGKTSWHELARPQVHGYDLLGANFLEDLKFSSIADEKVVRIFEAPRHFVDLAESLKISLSDKEKDRPMGASVPPLGLSNKADTASTLNSVPLSRRPFEGELASMTLWPEVEKVFGHGYESITLATSSTRQYIATACRTTSPEHAVVRLYDVANWQLVGDPLSGHSLTVTQIAFSPDDQYVLTVSRDRSWRLYQKQETGGYLPVSHELKPHARIIWDCAWATEGDIFATASRDKTVKIWSSHESNKWRCVTTIKAEEAATALDFAPFDAQHRRLLAIGLENGQVLVYSNTEDHVWQHQITIDSSRAHVNHINRLRWRPMANNHVKELASCSEDGTLRILIVHPATD